MTRRIGRGTQAALLVVGLAVLAIGCNNHPVALEEAGGSVTVHEDVTPGAAQAVDILWVIDNSGSMCEEQESLRENFRYFISTFAEQGIDFQIGTTTTQMVDKDTYPLEEVARPGHIQAVPQPVPSHLDECHGEEGSGDSATDGYEPIRSAIETAVDSCTKDPDQWQSLKDVTNGEIDCHLTEGCEENDEKEPHELFPVTDDGEQPTWETPAEESPYREIPLVMRAEDYQNDDGTLDEEQLQDDFACMSLVGTGGYAIEEGLDAAVEAVSPEMTGGPVEDPIDESAPNHGLIRQDANFSTVFVTDENDCSGIGNVSGSCGSDICAFANNPNTENSPLDSTGDLAEDFRSNLAESKGGELDEDGLLIGSIHGKWQRYGEHPDNPVDFENALTAEDCEDLDDSPGDDLGDAPSCDNDRFGRAFSGDRYERFLLEFGRENVFPALGDDDEDEEEHLPGLICEPSDVGATLKSLGGAIAEGSEGCIKEAPYACEEDDDCPDFAHEAEDDGSGPRCEPFGDSGDSYCDSAVQVRMYPREGSDTSLEDLEEHDYCLTDTIDSELSPGGCIVDRDKYSLDTCGSQDDAAALRWEEDGVRNALEGFEIDLVYATTTDE